MLMILNIWILIFSLWKGVIFHLIFFSLFCFLFLLFYSAYTYFPISSFSRSTKIVFNLKLKSNMNQCFMFSPSQKIAVYLKFKCRNYLGGA